MGKNEEGYTLWCPHWGMERRSERRYGSIIPNKWKGNEPALVKIKMERQADSRSMLQSYSKKTVFECGRESELSQVILKRLHLACVGAETSWAVSSCHGRGRDLRA